MAMMGRDPIRVVAQVLKRLYPQNPDVVLGREARSIVLALTAEGLLSEDETEVRPPAACNALGHPPWPHVCSDYLNHGWRT